MHNLHQIAIALKTYWNDYRAYPPPPVYRPDPDTGCLIGTGGLYVLYEEGYITSKEILYCPDDPKAKKNPPAGYSSYNGMDLDCDGAPDFGYNFFGYDQNGRPLLQDYPLPPSEERKKPRLKNRYAPDYTIVTHCPFHREFFGDKPEVQRDLVLRLSGDVKALPWPQVDWVNQRE